MRHIVLCVLLTLLTACCDESALSKSFIDIYSDESSKRNEAALALARCGSRSNKAVPRLAQMLYDDNVGVQSSAAYALRKIATPEAEAALEEAIAKRDRRK